MNTKMVLSLMVTGLIGVSFVAPSFAQNTVVPTEPAVSNMEKAADKSADSTMKPKTQHKHYKAGKGTKKGTKKGTHKKAHKKAEAEKQADAPVNQVNN